MNFSFKNHFLHEIYVMRVLKQETAGELIEEIENLKQENDPVWLSANYRTCIKSAFVSKRELELKKNKKINNQAYNNSQLL